MLVQVIYSTCKKIHLFCFCLSSLHEAYFSWLPNPKPTLVCESLYKCRCLFLQSGFLIFGIKYISQLILVNCTNTSSFGPTQTPGHRDIQYMGQCSQVSVDKMQKHIFFVCLFCVNQKQKPGNSRPESSVDLRGAQLHWANELSSKKNVFKVTNKIETGITLKEKPN